MAASIAGVFWQAVRCIRECRGRRLPGGAIAANNYADDLVNLQRFEEARTLLRKTMPVARRVLGECHRLTLKIRRVYAKAIYKNPAAPLDDLREALTTLEDTERTARRVLGGAHPTTELIEQSLHRARAALRTRAADVESLREAVAAMTAGDA